MENVKRVFKGKYSSPAMAFGVGAILGILFFATMFGFSVVNPVNVQWILNLGGDLAQHYFGWAFFRDADWTFPFGVATNLAYPYGVPVTFMDSIPLLAIVFKILSPILPETFQYLGIFTFVSFTLQGGIAGLIISRFTKNIYIIALCSLFFILTPMIVMRSFVHTALTAHWIILLAIYILLLYKSKPVTLWRGLWVWTSLMVAAVLIHPYFLPMVMALFAIFIIQTYRRESWWKTVVRALSPVGIAVLAFGLAGGLASTDGALNKVDLDLYSLNIVSLVDPMGASAFSEGELFRDDRFGGFESNEKLNYLGLGLMLLIPVVFYIVLNTSVAAGHRIKKVVKRWASWRNISSIIVLVGLGIFSLGTTIKLSNHVLFTLPVPDVVESLWLTFRSSARMFWPIYYLIIISLLVFVIRAFKRAPYWAPVIFIIPFLVIQFTDLRLSDQFRAKKAYVASARVAHSEAGKSIIVGIKDRYCNKDHMISLSPYGYLEEFIIFAQPALACGMTMSEGYYSHGYKLKEVREFAAGEKQKIIDGTADFSKNLYLTTDGEFVSEIEGRYAVERLENWFIVKGVRDDI
ncbi:hypothetical protein KI440_00260 [Candidatus Saccharibacteria bacterium TM7i]|nr:hypothetical protein KI440_00260 [Candidatus Saccharibacteria bacterium TM7i]